MFSFGQWDVSICKSDRGLKYALVFELALLCSYDEKSMSQEAGDYLARAAEWDIWSKSHTLSSHWSEDKGHTELPCT